jgi:hypothetical protein
MIHLLYLRYRNKQLKMKKLVISLYDIALNKNIFIKFILINIVN